MAPGRCLCPRRGLGIKEIARKTLEKLVGHPSATAIRSASRMNRLVNVRHARNTNCSIQVEIFKWNAGFVTHRVKLRVSAAKTGDSSAARTRKCEMGCLFVLNAPQAVRISYLKIYWQHLLAWPEHQSVQVAVKPCWLMISKTTLNFWPSRASDNDRFARNLVPYNGFASSVV